MVGMITYVQRFGGSEPLGFGRAKTCKIRRDLAQLSTLTANISEIGLDIKN